MSKTIQMTIVVWLLVAFAAGRLSLADSNSSEGKCTVASLIEAAGNANDDETRLNILKQLQQMPHIDEQLKSDSGRLIKEVDRWVNADCLWYFMNSKDKFGAGVDERSPLYPIVCFYRARILIWEFIEYGNALSRENMTKPEYFATVYSYLQTAKKAFNENRIVRMYLGEPIPAKKTYSGVAGAPEWAALQREGLERLADIVEWWIDNRMREDGQYGGEWGDDCEMWRDWVPVLIAFEEPKIISAQRRLSEGIMNLEEMRLGYTTRFTDVQHSSEYSADAITPMIHLEPNNPVWSKRALRPAELMEKLWTGENQRGFLHFKSIYLNAEKVGDKPEDAWDTVYHTRVVQPALLYWQLTGDQKLGSLFSRWIDGWVDASMRAEDHKPAGIIPSAIHWPDGRAGKLAECSKVWRDFAESAYGWPSSMPSMTNTMLLTYYMTGDDKYLKPIRSMAEIRLKYLKNPPQQEPQPGSEAWCASKDGFTSRTCAKYNVLTGSREFDELLKMDGNSYVRYRLTGDSNALVKEFRQITESLRMNFECYTSEVRFTDRVFSLPDKLFGSGFPPGIEIDPALKQSPDLELLYFTSTGDTDSIGYLPLYAVRWLTPPRNIAIMVTKADKKQLEAELFHFGEDNRKMSAELYLLEPGVYTYGLWKGSSTSENIGPTTEFFATGRRTKITFELPARLLCTLRICRKD